MSVRIVASCREEVDSSQRTVVEAETPASLGAEFDCTVCGGRHPLHRQAITASGGLLACVVCAHPELYTRKDFPVGLGVAIVVLAAVLAPFTWYLSLVAAAAVDALLFHLARDSAVCYACGSRHHHFEREPRHPGFDHEIAERIRFGERAIMGKPMRPR